MQILGGLRQNNLFSWGNERSLQEATCQEVYRIPGEWGAEGRQDLS